MTKFKYFLYCSYRKYNYELGLFSSWSVFSHTSSRTLRHVMLIVYLEPFQQTQQQLLLSWQQHVRYWPRTWSQQDTYNAAIPTDWWLLFGNVMYADIWLLRYPEQSRIIRTLLD